MHESDLLREDAGHGQRGKVVNGEPAELACLTPPAVTSHTG